MKTSVDIINILENLSISVQTELVNGTVVSTISFIADHSDTFIVSADYKELYNAMDTLLDAIEASKGMLDKYSRPVVQTR